MLKLKNLVAITITCTLISACDKNSSVPTEEPTEPVSAEQEAEQASEPVEEAPVEAEPEEEKEEQTQLPEATAEELERLKETCAKLEQPTQDACKVLHMRVMTKEQDAIKDMHLVFEGTRVVQNMVYLEEAVAKTIESKYGSEQ